jgi:hypothetical protein
MAKYDENWFVPPKGVQQAAERGLNNRRKYGRGGLTNKQASEHGVGSGVQRAVNLKNGNKVSPQTIKRMVSFFARHEQHKNAKKPDGSPGAGKIAWDLWGSDAGKRWANSVKNKMESADKKEKSKKTKGKNYN